MSHDLHSEARAFDARIREREAHGFVPDLRAARPVPWFYNNPWRHPELANLVFGGYLAFATEHLPAPPARVLEVACGPGHLSLELARAGYEVTGIDISADSINLADRTAARAERGENFGHLRYAVADFFEWDEGPYDAICVFLAMHHFASPVSVTEHMCSLLRPGGTVVVVEPARDWFSRTDAAAAVLIRQLLSLSDRWYTPIELPMSIREIHEQIDACLNEYREARDANEAEQSPHDNACGAEEMLAALRGRFREISWKGGYALSPRLVGGIRGDSDQEALALARYIALFDTYCVNEGLLQPGVFYFAGRSGDQRVDDHG